MTGCLSTEPHHIYQRNNNGILNINYRKSTLAKKDKNTKITIEQY